MLKEAIYDKKEKKLIKKNKLQNTKEVQKNYTK